MDLSRARELARGARVARLATINASNSADLVPIAFALVDDDTIVSAVDHKPKTTTALRRLDNIRARPTVTLLVDHYDDDWDSLWWVRVRGDGRVVEPGESEHAAAVAALVAKYHQYVGRPPAGPAIVVRALEWRGWSAS
jgi:PPOX class probable F420-dependent enzyme